MVLGASWIFASTNQWPFRLTYVKATPIMIRKTLESVNQVFLLFLISDQYEHFSYHGGILPVFIADL